MTSLERSDAPAQTPVASRRSARRITKLRVIVALAAVSITGAGVTFSYHQYRKTLNPVLQARARLEAGDAANAKLLLLGALHTRPDNAEAYYLLAQVSLRLGDPISAEHLLHKAGTLGIPDTKIKLPLATALLGERRAQEALNLLIPADASADELPGLLLARARGLRQLHDDAATEATLAEAGRVAPKLIDVPLATGSLALEQHDLTRAEGEADRALLLNGRSSDALLLKAQVMEQRGKLATAIELLGKTPATNARGDRVRLERARMLLTAGRVAEARTELDTVLAAEPGNAMAMFLKANVLAESHDYEGADLLLQKVSRGIPLFTRGWYTVALVKLNLEQLEKAEEAIDKFVARAPGDMSGRKLQARIGLAAKRPDQAIEALGQFISAGTADAETFDLEGAAQTMANRFAQAVSSFGSAAALAPKNPDILAHLGLARLLLGDGPGAVDALDRSLELSPSQLEVSKQLVVAAVVSGAPERAAKFLATLRSKAGETASTSQLEALLDLAQLDPAAASTRLAASVARNPADHAIKLQLARVLLIQGQAADAELVLSGLLAHEPTQPDALNLLVPLLERSGRVARAATIIEAACVSAPGNPQLALMLASMYTRAGDPAKALAVFGGGALQHDKSPAVLLSRAAAELAAGQPAAARATYAALLASTPGQPGVVAGYANFLSTQGDNDEAHRQIVLGLAAYPGSPELQEALVNQSYKTGGLTAALSVAETLRNDPINLPRAALLQGELLSGGGKHAEAAAAFEAELIKSPSTNLVMHAAGAEKAAHGPIAAIQVLRPWVRAHPADLSALAMLSTMLTVTKQTSAAAEVLESLLAQQPNDTRLMNNLASAYHELGDGRAYPLALRAYLSTFDPNIADTFGQILLAADKTREAVTVLRFARRELPDALPVQLHLARAVLRAGLGDEARTMLTNLVTHEFDGRAAATQLLASMSAR